MKQSSIALHMAHTLHADEHKIILGVSRQEVRTWRDCLTMGWYFVRFRKWLSNGIVTFSFQKLNGDVREARGTLNNLLIPRDKMPKGSSKIINHKFETINFYDLDKQEWRSFSISHFIGFVTVWELKESDKRKVTKRKL